MRLTRTRGSRRGSGVLAACAVAGLAVAVAACGPVGSGSGSSTVGTTPTSGGTATFATLPGLPANYIFPMAGGGNFTAINTDDFQYLMYRPLYWFGDGTQPTLDPQLSLAELPVYSGQTVKITLKPYMWSNGEPVSAQDVVFWINMMNAEDANGNWGGFVPGYFPQNVTDVHAVSANTVEMTIKGPYSEDWFTDNELSQITPLPAAWDVTGPGKPSDCATSVSACAAVYNYLSKDAGNPTSWVSFGLWDIVDGPWKLLSATNTDQITLGFNSKYSGAVPPFHISRFVLLPFTTEQAEYNQLQAPGGNPVDYGYLPTDDAPVPPAGSQVGSNPITLGGYKLTVIYPWALSYFPYNFDSPAGPIFKQLYFRQAFQSLVDQEGVVSGPMHGYGKVTTGPVADYPVTSYLSPALARAGDQWTLNPALAKQRLASHGWSINPGGVDRCISPGSGPSNCGPGIAGGTKLQFSLLYSSGLDWMESEIKELVSNASLVGISISANGTDSTSQIVGDAVFCTPSATQTCLNWELADWGSWTYSPDYVPTGEELFQTTSVANGGHYSNPTNNAEITATLEANKPQQFQQAMYKWENFLADQLPVVYQPNVATLVESVNNLYIGPQSPTLTINPEDWYYLK
jgi:peptide/nickel transport system substrate-binding protein